jgi:hypothetical protein
MEHVVVPEFEHRHRQDDRAQLQPPHELGVAVEGLVSERVDREAQQRGARPRSLREPLCHAVEDAIDRSWRLQGWRGPRRVGALRTPPAVDSRPVNIAAPSAER